MNIDFLIPTNANNNSGLKYQLYAVVNHYESQYFGHYTAFAKLNNKDDFILPFNDIASFELKFNCRESII